MTSFIATASPLEVAALWHMNLLSGDDVAAVCMMWLEQDLDGGNPDIATFAGQSGLVVTDIAPIFERVLTRMNGRPMDRHEAILRALRLHLALALKREDLMKGVQLVIQRFAHFSGPRLVWNPRRAQDQPDRVFAAQELGLEYVYGDFYAFDDIGHLNAEDQAIAKGKLLDGLRQSVRALHDHLSSVLAH